MTIDNDMNNIFITGKSDEVIRLYNAIEPSIRSTFNITLINEKEQQDIDKSSNNDNAFQSVDANVPTLFSIDQLRNMILIIMKSQI